MNTCSSTSRDQNFRSDYISFSHIRLIRCLTLKGRVHLTKADPAAACELRWLQCKHIRTDEEREENLKTSHLIVQPLQGRHAQS